MNKKLFFTVGFIGLLYTLPLIFSPQANARPGDLMYESTIGQPAVNFLSTTSAVTKDSYGNYYVLSYGSANSKVTKYAANKQPILEFGAAGTGDGQFNSTTYPWGIYVDPDDNVWVADTGNHRYQKFDSNGNFILKIGGTSAGTGDGQFNNAYGMTFTDDGFLWIADRNNSRLQKFDLDGNFITKVTNAMGANLNQPMSITTDENGYMYVASRHNHRIQKYDHNGTYIATFGIGTAGAANGQLNEPTTVLVDPSNGDVYTYEIFNRRISVFSATGTFLRNFSVELPGVAGHRSFSMIWDEGNITLAIQSAANNKIQTVTKTGTLISVFNGNGFGQTQLSPTLSYGAVDPLVIGGKVYVSDSRGSRFVAFNALTGEYETESHYGSRFFATALATDMVGDVYVLNQEGLHKYTPDGQYISQVLTSANTGSNFLSGDVFVDVEGNIWITGSGTSNQVRKFSSSGVLLQTIGSTGAGNGQFNSPTSFGFSTTELYVVDSGNNRMQVFDHDGNYLRQFGASGSADGQFNNPYGIALDDDGNVYVSDRGNNRIQKFTSEGVYLTQFGTTGSSNDQLSMPMGLYFSEGKLYVGDALNNRV